MPKRVSAWQCSFGCGKTRKAKATITNHERTCFENPKRRACQTCGNRLTNRETSYNRNHGGDPGSTDHEYLVVYCEAKKERLDGVCGSGHVFNCGLWRPCGTATAKK